MARINLRPWREELRAEKQKQFVAIVFGFLLISGGVGFLWNQHVLARIEYQEQRNSFLKNEIARLDKQIKEIKELKDKLAELNARMKVIQDLQGKRPVIVRLFDELVRNVPEGVYLTQWSKKGEVLGVKGIGESNSRISGLMRSLDGSDWYKEPNLTTVKALKDDETKSTFIMSVKQETPGAKNKEEDGA